MVGSVQQNTFFWLEAKGIIEKIAGKIQKESARWKKPSKNREPVLLRTTEPRRLLDLGQKNRSKTGGRS
jgi:hypothetical protein